MEQKEMGDGRIRAWLRLGLRLAGLGLGLVFLRLLSRTLSVLLPFLAAFGVAAALNPLVRRMQKRLGWSRRRLSLMAVLALFGTVGGGLTVFVYLVGREMAVLVRQWEGVYGELFEHGKWMEQLQKILPGKLASLAEILGGRLNQWAQENVSALLSAAAQWAGTIAAALPGILLGLAVFLLASYFLTAEYPYLRTRVLQNMSQELCDLLGLFRKIAAAAMGGYLKAQLVLSAGVFVLLLGGFVLWGQDYALLLALGLAVLDFIPLIGAGTVLAPWAAVSVLMGEYKTAAWTAVLLGMTAVFRRLAEPKVVGDQTGLSPVLSLMSIYIGMRLAGVIGMILGPIVTLMVLNLSGLGLFHGLRQDINFIRKDICDLFRGT